MEVVT
jgi:hypothetical protein